MTDCVFDAARDSHPHLQKWLVSRWIFPLCWLTQNSANFFDFGISQSAKHWLFEHLR